MNGYVKRLTASVIAIFLIFGIIVTTIILRSSSDVKANVSFNGISSIVGSSNKDTPFRIYEMVPDESISELGYMIDGKEPIKWLEEISAMYNADGTSNIDRESYVNDVLKNKFKDIIDSQGTKNTNILHYEKYEESYVLKQDAQEEWKQLKLKGTEIVPQNTSGYEMVDVGQGVGSYSFKSDFIPQQEPKGDYNQNVLNYVYSGKGYYGLPMKEISVDGANTYEQMLGSDGGAYRVSSATAYVNQEKFDTIVSERPNASIYRVSKENTKGAYEFCGYASTMGALDFDTYIYFSLKMEFVPVSEMDDSKKYYDIDDEIGIRFFYDQTGEYSGVIDEANPYIKVNDGVGGNFLLDTTSFVYTYVGPGNGSYELIEANDKKLDYPVNLDFVYYKGGFSNNNWFKNGVFNQDDSLGEENDIYIDVLSYTPEIYNYFNCSAIDLLYINGSASSVAKDDENGNKYTNGFNKDLDITWQTMLEIVQRANMSGIYMPVIVDYSVFNGKVDENSTNVQKLAALLCATNYDELNITNETREDEINWSSLKFTNDADSHYIKGNIYVVPGDKTDSIPFIFKDFTSKMIETTNVEDVFYNNYNAIGFGEIAECINEENLIRKTENNAGNNYEYFDLDISKAIAVEYAICYANRRILDNDNSLNILDIEPCTATVNSSGVINYNMLKEWLGANCPEKSDVSITIMSSTEFVGKIEDLNKYDLIYFGLSTDKFPKDEKGNVKRNDANMNKMIYTNVGDIVTIQHNGHAGLLENDYNHDSWGNRTSLNTNMSQSLYKNGTIDYNAINTYRGPGNDITTEKIEKLNNYLKAGLPIIFADGFYKNNYTEVNDVYIDNSSNIYDFIKQNITNNYTMSVSQAKDRGSVLYSYLTMNKPEIVLTPMETVKDKDYVKLDSNVITYTFTINNNGGVDINALFDVKLMLDANADGKFSVTQEAIPGNEIRVYQNGKNIAPIYHESSNSYLYELPAGAQYNYTLSYTLPDAYVGIIPWKLNVSQSTNSLRYDSKQGYFYRKNSSVEKVEIKILQINSSGGGNFDMQNQASSDTKFRSLLNLLEDYKLTIKTVNSDTFGNNYGGLYAEGANRVNGKYYLEDYDMIIIGFKDMYSINNTNNCVDGIRQYINDGNPVLFTHDTTSFGNNSLGGNEWGYDFNTKIRDLVGMDRYGVLSNTAIQSGNTLYAGSYEYNNAVAYAKENNTDLAYLPGSNRQIITRQNQGFTYLDLNRYQYNSYTSLLYNGLARGKSYQAEMNVQQVNAGQITTYPFKIPETFKVNKTHMQYYQLDLNQDADEDGESDIVVWYTLGDSNAAGYNTSLKDVRNNYYIYTMGNVTYSGVGHSSISNNDNELKLYINTMIAAYNAGTHEPTISLKENEEKDSPDLGTLYVSVDEALKMQVEGEDAKESIFFTITDTNLIRNLKDKRIYADFYVEVTEDEYNAIDYEDEKLIVSREDKNVYLKKIKIDTLAADEDSAYNYVRTSIYKSGVTYKAEIPLNLLGQNKNYVDVYCVAYTDLVKLGADKVSDGKIITTSKGYESFRIQRVSLQDLD